MKIELFCKQCNKNFYGYKKKSGLNFCSYGCFKQYREDKTINQDFFEKIDTEEKSYWLGFLYADGSITKKRRKQKTLTLSLSLKDKDHVVKFANIFGSSVREYNTGIYKACVCSITSKNIWENLYSKGFFPNKTYINSDKIFNFVPDKLKKDFIRGFFDGDGGISINKKTGGCSFHIVGTKKNLLKMKKIIINNAGVSNPKLIFKKNTDNIFILEWSGILQIESIRKFLYKKSSIFLERKLNRFNEIKNRYNIFMRNKKNKFRGVKKSGSKFISVGYNNGKYYYLGTYVDEKDAAKAYDQFIIKFKKPLYRLNFDIMENG